MLIILWIPWHAYRSYKLAIKSIIVVNELKFPLVLSPLINLWKTNLQGGNLLGRA